jgi:hypothetical protein
MRTSLAAIRGLVICSRRSTLSGTAPYRLCTIACIAESLALQVRVLNAVAAAARRPVSFVSFTVPQYQREDGYFAPLAQLTADPGTELNFALVPYHPAEQAPGTTDAQVRLIDAALAASPGGGRDWGVCTECGLGRASRDEIPALLDLHSQIIAAR